MKNILIALLFLGTAAQAEPRGWASKDEVSRRSGHAVRRAEKFEEHCGKIQDVSGLAGGVRQLAVSMKRLQESVDRGRDFNGCVGEFKDIRNQYTRLEQEFNQRHSRHQNWRVTYGWYQISLAYLEMEWAFTQGDPIP